MKRLLFTFLLLCGLPLMASTHYIDFTSGADTNTGTATGTPWKHAPGMLACANNCSTYTPVAGDNFILKGGVTWPNASLAWDWSWSGASGSKIYLGVDQTWYDSGVCGASWCRPILDGGSTAVVGNGTNNNMLHLESTSWVIVDNIEFTGLWWNNGTFGANNFIMVFSATDFEIKNCYFHGWAHGASALDSQAVQGSTSPTDVHLTASFHDNVVDGQGTDGGFGGLFGGPETVYNNVFRYLCNMVVISYAKDVHSNLFEHSITLTAGGDCLDPTNHSNYYESVGDASGGSIVYNNVFRLHDGFGGAPVVMWAAPSTGDTTYVWNNVLYDLPSTLSDPLSCGDSSHGGNCNFYNNTIECGPDSAPSGYCVRNETAGTVTATNNHYITSGSVYSGVVGGSNNITQTLGTANGQGFTSAQTFAFSPTLLSNSTVGAGSDLTSSCTGNRAPLCSDTSYAVTYDAANHKVVAPARTTVARPSGGAWDSGAFEFVATSALSGLMRGVVVIRGAAVVK